MRMGNPNTSTSICDANRTYIHANIQTYIHKYTHTWTSTYIHANIHTSLVHAHTHTSTPTSITYPHSKGTFLRLGKNTKGFTPGKCPGHPGYMIGPKWLRCTRSMCSCTCAHACSWFMAHAWHAHAHDFMMTCSCSWWHAHAHDFMRMNIHGHGMTWSRMSMVHLSCYVSHAI